MTDEHKVVTYAEEGGRLIARFAPPSPGMRAQCRQCQAIVVDAHPEHGIVRCPETQQWGMLDPASPLKDAV